MSPTTKQFKVVILGDAKVGKTCLLSLFTHDTCKRHLDRYIATTGVDFCPKSFEIDGETYNFHFCDVSGITRQKSDSKAPPYYKGAHGAVIVFDVTDADSHENATDVWLKDVKKFTDKKSFQKVIIANKCDDKANRVIDSKAVKELSDDHSVPCFETSAITEANVDEAFMALAKSIRLQFDPKEGDKKPTKSRACSIL